MKDIILVKDKTKCAGCQMCANICPRDAIVMQEDACGFVYPEIITDRCVQCGLCVETCDYTKEAGVEKRMPLKTYAVASTDKKILETSSSGGVFSALVKYTKDRNGAVCGCILDEGLYPRHVCTEDEKVMERMRGSKYVQSDMGQVYRQVRERVREGKFTLFTGTPCQVAALYAFLGKREIPELLTVDLICHGVPSARMFHKFIAYLEKKHQTNIVDFKFRSKRYGWQRFTSEFIDDKGKVKNIGKVNEFYHTAFSTGNIMRPNCFSCQYAQQARVGDITLGDLWGREKMQVSFNTSRGVSFCALNTKKAQQVFAEIAGDVLADEVPYALVVKANHCLRAPTPKGTKWEAYMQAIKDDRIEKMALAYIKSHKKTIIRNKLKLRVPQSIFDFVRKCKYGVK